MHFLSDEKAAGLGLGVVRVPQGQLVRSQTEGVVAHLHLTPLRTTDPAEHGLLLSTIAWKVYAHTQNMVESPIQLSI